MSRFPPISRGGIVRKPPAAERGRAVSGAGSATGPPRSRIRSSRRRSSSSLPRDGATPTTPAKVSAGTATPGSSPDRATSSSISHLTRNGSVKRSARKPNPGITAVTPKSAERYSRNSTSSTSPGFAPMISTGPASGCPSPRSSVAQSACVLSRVSCPASPSSASRVSVSPAATVTTGAMSGCQRLCIREAAPRGLRCSCTRPPRRQSTNEACRAGGARRSRQAGRQG